MELTEKLQQKIDNGREYRSMQMEVAETDEYMVVGYATTYEDPYHLYNTLDKKGNEVEVKEVVSRNAFDNTDMSDVIFQYDHEGRVFARLSNKTMTLESDEHGLLVRAYLGGTEIGRNLYEEIKDVPFMEYVDVCVDGPYVASLNIGFNRLRYRGSSNQRVIDVKKSRASGKVVLFVDFDGLISESF